MSDITVLHLNGKLEIVATVDCEGLEKLREILVHYEDILKLEAEACARAIAALPLEEME